ncbi:hypothetical protein [Parerythrobacter lacustris]|uniref:Uncharacterized protein n=1 Tax=Parerythrobacter lacustris TaxID=2969984 RepID=A0ABT1XTI4_9SPHN|nr:hypothetical protein [Parerythrobacter lacustris]MCR2834569.1 hypothetical protein [Parerythrobacter lacustris]
MFGSFLFAISVLACSWLLGWVVGLSAPVLPGNIAISLSIASLAWSGITFDFGASSFSEFFSQSLARRSLHISFALLMGLTLSWLLLRIFTEWSIEPNLRDFGPCTKFTYGECGSVDLSETRRERSVDLVNAAMAAVIAFSPITLVLKRVRNFLR